MKMCDTCAPFLMGAHDSAWVCMCENMEDAPAWVVEWGPSPQGTWHRGRAPPRALATPAAWADPSCSANWGPARIYKKKVAAHMHVEGDSKPMGFGFPACGALPGPGDGHAAGGWGGAAVLPEACRGYAIRWRGHEHNNCASSSKFYEMRSTPTYNSITATKTHGKKTPAAIPCGGRGQC